jgi:hypothetical protein
MDLVTYCQLKDTYGIPQIGFASSTSGARPGTISMAAAVAKVVGQRFNHSNWMGVFPVSPDFYIFVAVIKDALLPEGDFAGTKTEVLERFGQEFGQTNQWEAIFAPKALQIGNSEDLPLEDLLPFRGGKIKLKSPCRLERVTGFSKTPFVVAGAVAALVAAGFLVYHFLPQIEQKVEVPPAVETAITGKEQPPIILPFPWKTQPEAPQFAVMCLEAFQKMPQGPGAWNQVSLECSQNSVKVSWQRGASNVAFLKEVIPSVKFDDAGDSAEISLPRQLPPPYEGEAVSVISDARIALISVAQANALAGPMKIEPPTTTVNPEGRKVIKSWANINFSLTGQIPPWDFVKLVGHIHGLRLNRAILTGDQWKIEGDIYGK